jgi:tetratricopeptide (TPR) repeat protein
MTTLQSPRLALSRFAIAAVCAATMASLPETLADDSKDVWVEVRSPHFVVASNAGEKQARHVAQQFEEIRGTFQTAFPKLRLDLGKPIIILAAKNENSLKVLLPGYWEQKGSVHPAGMYIPSEEKHYVALRLDTEGENPFHVLYHEYTHALVHLNFRPLPLWLDEGLAEFYGNTVITDEEIELGRIDRSHLYLLQQTKLIPVETLLQVDHSSPYYNEQNRASIFYAESWALVHFLMLDPDARKQQLLTHFLNAWDKSGNQVQAAQLTFGDLKKFGQTLEGYAHQQSFHFGRLKSTVGSDKKSYASRALSAAESLALRGDFYLQTRRMKEAEAALEAAEKQDPNLAAAHESLGLFYFRQRNLAEAAKELDEATHLNSNSFLTYYFSAMLNLRGASDTPDAWPKAEARLEKAIALNPSFAPAYSSLASLYSLHRESQEKALAAARRAVELEPGNIAYSINLGFVLLGMNKTEEARALAARMFAGAKTPWEVQNARSFQQAVEGNAEFRARSASAYKPDADESEAPEPPAPSAESKEAEATNPAPAKKPDQAVPAPAKKAYETAATQPPSAQPPAASEGPVNVTQNRVYQMTGKIIVLNCAQTPEVTLTLALSSIEMKLHAANLSKVDVKDSSRAAKNASSGCATWKGRSANMSYHLTPGQNYDGEIVSIQFF